MQFKNINIIKFRSVEKCEIKGRYKFKFKCLLNLIHIVDLIFNFRLKETNLINNTYRMHMYTCICLDRK